MKLLPGNSARLPGWPTIFFTNFYSMFTNPSVENDIDQTQGTSILLAEPLSKQTGLVSSNWLANYREHLRRLLAGKGFSEIDFLPEPFGVYQYYRYGGKHLPGAERGKKHALVVDFGARASCCRFSDDAHVAGACATATPAA